MINFNKLVGRVSGLKGMPNPQSTTIGTIKRSISKTSRFRMRIKKGLPNSRKMKEGQLKLCTIKEDLYLVVKHNDRLFKTKFTQEKL
jgi:hypothetical protein